VVSFVVVVSCLMLLHASGFAMVDLVFVHGVIIVRGRMGSSSSLGIDGLIHAIDTILSVPCVCL